MKKVTAPQAHPSRRVLDVSVLLALASFSSANLFAQQTISSGTTSTVVATGGDLTVDSGVYIDTHVSKATGILVSGVTVDNLINNGTINTSTTGGSALYFDSTSALANIVNNGSMTSKSGIQLYSPAAITNNNYMFGSDRAITLYTTAAGSSVTNNSYLIGSYSAISNRTTLSSVYNASGATLGGIFGVENFSGSITTLTNYGNIYSSHWVPNSAIGGGTITTLNNFGTIYGANGGMAVSSTVTNLVNGQGGSSSALTMTNQATNYSIFINSPTSYGQLSIQTVTGAMGFDVYSGSTITSGYYYTNVLSGIGASDLSNTTGTFGSTPWHISLQSGSSTIWDLCFGVGACSYTLATNILSGSSYLSSDLGTSVNPKFDGGTLQIASAGAITQNFAITSNNGTIDQNGLTSTFSGNFSDDSGGVPGKIIIENSGTAGVGAVVLSGTNTHSGGTEVQAGANLSIASAAALGTGTLALVGSATVPATLSTTATLTISNAITVSGDPVFNVAPGTTTTIASAITDGGTPGDVVVAGGGTLQLNAANTYTGLTSITAASTLALSGIGSIANSTAVNNTSGTFNITGATGNVTLGGSYTQAAGGNLAMNITPTNNQKLLVTGTAALNGGLSLSASAGTYAAGRYTLLTANGVSGRFGAFSTNLSSYTSLGYSLGYDANAVYLLLTPASADTQASLQSTAQALRYTHAAQSAALVSGFGYDCPVFDQNNVCVGGGMRNARVNGESPNNTSALLLGAYRVNAKLWIGGYLDQNLNTRSPGGAIKLGDSSPMLGLFGVWSQNADGTGWEARVAAGYGEKSATVQRPLLGTAEAGLGSSSLRTEGVQAIGKYGFAVANDVVVSPYVGIRRSTSKLDGYSEQASTTVTAPLNYNALYTKATTALAGIGATYKLTPQTLLSFSAGLESDTSSRYGAVEASGITGITSVDLNPNPNKTRATGTISASFDVARNQRISVTGTYRQEQFNTLSTTSVIATYVVGL